LLNFEWLKTIRFKSVVNSFKSNNTNFIVAGMEYIQHLSKDKKLKKLLDNDEPKFLKQRKKVSLYLCASIVSQQLSTKVADVIWKRFLNLYKPGQPSPQQL
jgi:DNA-3-methyladenine glycosylase II